MWSHDPFLDLSHPSLILTVFTVTTTFIRYSNNTHNVSVILILHGHWLFSSSFFYFYFLGGGGRGGASKYTLRQKCYAPQVPSNPGSKSWPPDHDSTFHVTQTPTLTTRPSVTVLDRSTTHPKFDSTGVHYQLEALRECRPPWPRHIISEWAKNYHNRCSRFR